MQEKNIHPFFYNPSLLCQRKKQMIAIPAKAGIHGRLGAFHPTYPGYPLKDYVLDKD